MLPGLFDRAADGAQSGVLPVNRPAQVAFGGLSGARLDLPFREVAGCLSQFAVCGPAPERTGARRERPRALL